MDPVDPDPQHCPLILIILGTYIRIGIRIRMSTQILIRINPHPFGNLLNISNYRLGRIRIRTKMHHPYPDPSQSVTSDQKPDLHQIDHLDPDLHQRDADQQHLNTAVLLTNFLIQNL